MASPQKENGYTPVANELMEALARIRINGEAWQVLSVILRLTYGWNKKEDAIALSQFVGATGLQRTSVRRAVRKLCALGLVDEKATGFIKKYRVVKDFDKWKPLTKKIHVTKKVRGGDQKGTKEGTKKSPTKELKHLSKDKDPAQSADITLFIDLFKLINPTYQKLFGHPPSRAACGRLLLLHPIDYWNRFMAGYQSVLNEDVFCPRATTPIKLENKLGDIEVYGRQRKADNLKPKVKII